MPDKKRYPKVSSNGSEIFTDKVDNTPGGVLTHLWRKIMVEDGLIPYIDKLTDKYVRNQELSNVSSVKRKNKSTLKMNMTAKSMSFKTFMDLVFNFLPVKAVSFTVKLTYSNGDSTEHQLNILSNSIKVDNTGIEENEDDE